MGLLIVSEPVFYGPYLCLSPQLAPEVGLVSEKLLSHELSTLRDIKY
jgi:hypothetical protein